MSWLKAYDQYSELARSDEVAVLSVDIFDTLLLRTTLPEPVKFRRFGGTMNSCFPRPLTNVRNPARYMQTLRELAARTIYHQKEMVRGGREATLDEIYAYMLRALRFHTELSNQEAAGLVEAFHRIEMDIESLDLTRNARLVSILEEAKRCGKPVIGISDMYLNRGDIGELLRRSGLDGLLDALYVSSEYGYGKGAGSLFEEAINDFDRLPAQVCHIGDNHHSDYVMPLSKGMKAIYAPRSRWWKLVARSRRYFDV